MSPKNSLLQWGARKAAEFFSRHPVVFFLIAFVYVILPFDVVPEAFVGPLGFLDDLFILLLPLLLRQYTRRHPASKDYYDTTAQ